MTPEVLASGRAAAETLMTDACTITRATGEPVLDEGTGQYVQDRVTVYSGKCRVQTHNAMGAERDAGEMFTIGTRVVVSLPMTGSAESGDLVAVTESAFTPQLVGESFTVRTVVLKSHPTAIRLECEES